MKVHFTADYSQQKQMLLRDLATVRNVRHSKYARRRLAEYRTECAGLHKAIDQINKKVMYLDKVVFVNP